MTLQTIMLVYGRGVLRPKAGNTGVTRAHNSNTKVKVFRLTVADGVVWASPSVGGTVFIFR